MLDDIMALVTTGEFEDNGWVRLLSAQWADTDLHLSLLLRTGLADAPDEAWLIACSSPRAHRLSLEGADNMLVAEDHVLLWSHTKPVLQTYFRRHGSLDPLAATGALYKRHAALTGRWIPFDRFLNTQVRLSELLAAPSGVLGQGPEPIMRAYDDVLRSFRFEVSHLGGGRPPSRLDEGPWVEETQQLFVFILGESFVVAPSFTSQRAERPRGEQILGGQHGRPQ